ncbi:amino acid ABC transporter permease [Reinekea marinisedimentorum]|uniref:Polar amino acid transport system permease protein n=1 Tax=Reinekea marinisedimentorum TaxID=230495 RepID=A0A4R3IG87_9GAMM|nr:amino acid ABC transporter permease [Reinekea marinisedimentorum]TCS44022.1 polar amino acid transport system permease protein [Reinekea marinisedimentorum]
MNNFPNKRRWRLNRLDIALLILLSIAAAWLWYRSSAGVNYHWNWSAAFSLILTPRADGSWPYLFQGFLATIRLSLWGMAFALVLGSALGICRHSERSWLRTPATAYIMLVRNMPPLVFIFIFYFFISNQLIPLLGLESLLREHKGDINFIQRWLFGEPQLWENLLSGVLCVGLLAAAYIAEIVRAGLESIEKGQWEAADSLGLSTRTKYRFIIAPQVFTAITPPLAGQAISLVKDSSIVSLISIQELTFVGTEMANSSGLIFEIWILVGLAYLALCFSLSLLFGRIEQHSRRHLNPA